VQEGISQENAEDAENEQYNLTKGAATLLSPVLSPNGVRMPVHHRVRRQECRRSFLRALCALLLNPVWHRFTPHEITAPQLRCTTTDPPSIVHDDRPNLGFLLFTPDFSGAPRLTPSLQPGSVALAPP